MDEKRLQKIEDKINNILEKIKPIKEMNYNMVILNEKMDKLADLEKNVQTLQNSFTFFNEQFEKFQEKLNAALQDVGNIKKEVQNASKENESLRKETKELKNTVTELHYELNAGNLEIAGIPEKRNENLVKYMIDIGKKINIKIEDKDIKYIKRTENAKKTNAVIIVHFANKELKKEIQQKGKQERVKTGDIGIAGASCPIYFNDCLSQYQKSLLYKCKTQQKQHNWKYVWLKEGKIFIRKQDKTPAIKIIDERDLENAQK